ncbi:MULTISPECIES: DUF2786 domain-containing protein [Rhodococcus]|uniref:DUF2786 domain-containing protein n=1 Tax=Rhodococcus TaxID=1827 RepID=UPI001B2FE3D5|nr:MULTISPECIES: DUF2786 domain-containing protein [Rhodococcus]MDV6292790.1 DUF2786 domain-containing protein [Rhodococcus aetherivorans]
MGRDRTYFRQAPAGSGASDEVFHLGIRPLLDELCAAYELGWQPADVLHVTARSGDATDVPLAAAAVLYDARRSHAADRAPMDWVQQLGVIAERCPGAARIAERVPPDAPVRHLGVELLRELPGLSRFQVMGLAFAWKYLPRFAPLLPPPSQWPPLRPVPAAGESLCPDPRVLARIRGLLAKAESTDYPEEAETLTAKAQELMTRYAIGAALLTGAETGAARGRRLHVDNPYAKEKVLLLTAIGNANRTRTVWFTKVGIATIVGADVDLQQVEVLFTSLSVQASRAVRAAGTGGRTGGAATAFRRAFLAGFAYRIGERLRQADVRATAAAAADASMAVTQLAPLLARRSEAVDSEFRRLFPTTRSTRTRSVDAEGWFAGRDAAESAFLTPGSP